MISHRTLEIKAAKPLSIKRVLLAAKLDTLFQFRSGLHLIYLVLSVFYIVIINQLPRQWGDIAVPLMIFSDPSVLGFFFIGGLVMLEKGQGILDLITVTPTRVGEYILGKVIALNAISLLASLAIAFMTRSSFNVVYLIVAVCLSGSFFTQLGFYFALTSQSVNQYFGKAILGMILIIVPCFSIIGFPYSQFFYLLPSVAAAKLVFAAFHATSIYSLLGCFLSLIIWNYLVYKLSIRRFKKHAMVGGA